MLNGNINVALLPLILAFLPLTVVFTDLELGS